jgi:uroporphyrinogen decarboxylase
VEYKYTNEGFSQKKSFTPKKPKMTSRERVLAAIEHRSPDRVPLDLGSNPSSGISAIGYANLMNHLGIPDRHPRVFDVVQQLARIDVDDADLLGLDILDVGIAFNREERDWTEVELPDGQKGFFPVWFKTETDDTGNQYARDPEGEIIAKMPAGATFFDQTVFKWQEGYPEGLAGLDQAMSKVLWSAFAHSPWDLSGQPEFWDTLREKCQELRDSTDRALMLSFGGNLFEWGTFLRRMDNFLMDPFLYPAEVEKLVEMLLERHISALEKTVAAVGDVVDIIRFGDDLGMSSGPFMPPETYRQFFKEGHTQLTRYVKKNSRMKTMLHSCGSIYPLIPDLIDAGFDILNPIQTNAFQMEPERLKSEFGTDVTFWGGGADTKSILNRGSAGEVRQHVLERLEIFSPGGGFVFNTVHNIMPDVPAENIVAMFRAVWEFNGYTPEVFNHRFNP